MSQRPACWRCTPHSTCASRRRGGLSLPFLQWLALASLAVIVAIAFALLIPGVWDANAAGPLRIFYLHDLLLGWVSTLLKCARRRSGGGQGQPGAGRPLSGAAAWR